MDTVEGPWTIYCPGEMAPFFRQFTSAHVVVPWVLPNLFDRKNLWNLPLNWVRMLRNYYRYFSDIKNEHVYVFFTSWALTYMYFIRRLSKHNKVELLVPEDNHSKTPQYFPVQKGLVAATMRWFSCLCCGVKTYILDKNVPAYEIVRTSLPWHEHLWDTNKWDVYKKYMKNSALVEGMEVIFFSENVTTEGADEESVVYVTDRLYEMLEKKFDNRYCVKGHPREPDIYGRMNYAKHILSRYILAETLMAHPWRFIISYYSESLVSAAMMTDATVISLINLFDWSNKELKQYWLKRFKEYDIKCPKSLKMLNDMLLKP